MTEQVQLAFSYRADSAGSQQVSGTIDAINHDDAMRKLSAMGLKVLDIAPMRQPPKPGALRGDDFMMFNQQLAQLTQAGLPVEQGLRLIADDMRTGGQREAIRRVADDLDRGSPMGEAFEKYASSFPPLYGKMIDAGVRSNNLPAILLNMGRHLEMIGRLRTILWRILIYPYIVLLAMVAVMFYLGSIVIPGFSAMYDDFGLRLGSLTVLVFAVARHINVIAWVVLSVLVGVPIAVRLLLLSRSGKFAIEPILLKLPLFGRALRADLLARWCDALQIGIEAKLDLPAAIDLANDAAGSPTIATDGRAIRNAVIAGQPLSEAKLKAMPGAIPAALQSGINRNDLSSTITLLSNIYQTHAEARLATIPSVLGPFIMLFIGILFTLLVLAVFMPLNSMLRGMTG